jgi:hypothetical protein
MKNSLALIEKTFIVYLILQTLLFNWLFNKNLYKYAFIVYLFYFLIQQFKTKTLLIRISRSGFLLYSIMCTIIILNFIVNGIYYRALQSLFNSFSGIFVFVFFISMLKYKKESLERFIIKFICPLFNIYFIINIPIILEQIKLNGFLMRFVNNQIYEDNITGLIGPTGTHRLTFYWIALILMNLYAYTKYHNKCLMIFTLLEIVFMAVISSYNDNTAFYYIFILIILQFMSKELFNFKVKRMATNLVIVMVLIICSNFLIQYNTQVSEFFNSRVMDKFSQIVYKYTIDNSDIKDEERISLYKYALEFGNGYELGTGIGSVQNYGDDTLPDHFGMSEISIKVYEGGLTYLIFIILLYSYHSYNILGLPKKIKSILIYLIIALNYAFLSMYTQVFSTIDMIFMLGLILCCFHFKYKMKMVEGM